MDNQLIMFNYKLQKQLLNNVIFYQNKINTLKFNKFKIKIEIFQLMILKIN